MSTNHHILQVSELTKKVRFMLESELNTVWLSGEISNFINASSGHWYLSLKDDKSQVRCAMFKGNNRRVAITPKNGQQVLVRAKVSLYEPRGDFQLIIEHLEDAGEGLLRQQFELLKQKLNQAGLFHLDYKKPLPETVTTIGIVTSPTGAAVKDIIAVLKRRNPLINIIIYPALVQGELAANDICAAIELANQRQECEVLIVGRGGGSLEDLWPFNEERVAYAIFNSHLPIISAVGHEIDTTLADYVADVRAPTPSAAAEIVAADTDKILTKLLQIKDRFYQIIKQKVIQKSHQQTSLALRLQHLHPKQKIQLQQQKTDELQLRLISNINQLLKQKNILPNSLTHRLHSNNPLKSISLQQANLQKVNKRLNELTVHKLANSQQKFVSLIEQLHLVSPLATLARGYTITRNDKQEVINKAGQLKDGDEISTQFEDGLVYSKVITNNSKH